MSTRQKVEQEDQPILKTQLSFIKIFFLSTVEKMLGKFKNSLRNASYYPKIILSKSLPCRHKKSRPNLIVIGSMKSGTSSLHSYLKKNSDIHAPPYKEPGYYLNDSERKNVLKNVKAFGMIKSLEDLHNYLVFGYKNQKYILDSSTWYTEAPALGSDVPKTMYSLTPDAKLIYLVRNPISRILSHYRHCLQLGIYSAPLEEILPKDQTFLERSLYAFQIKRFLEFFPREQIKILIFEEIIGDQEKLKNNLEEFLEISFAADTSIKKKNSSHVNSRHNYKSLSKSSYDLLISRLKDDKKEFDEILGRKIDWDLSETKWVHT